MGGLTLKDARIAFGGISRELVERPDGLVDLAERDAPAKLPAPRLLGPFEPLLLGWASREPFVGAHTVATANGMFHPCVLVNGRVVGTWGLQASTLTVRLLEEVKAPSVNALRRDAADVMRFLALEGRVEGLGG
jgi:Winged helix DNA-binding domain